MPLGNKEHLITAEMQVMNMVTKVRCMNGYDKEHTFSISFERIGSILYENAREELSYGISFLVEAIDN
tara:strand:- start:263 stop:466 length:204 start_codon:yes stop_codon:yes gene_type:complete